MNARRYILRQTGLIAAGHSLCAAGMCGIFALLSAYDRTVLLGSIVGSLLAVLNFFLMSVGAMIAADRAAAQNVKGGKDTVKLSFVLRLLLLAVVLFAFAKSGLCNVLALVLPLAFSRPIFMVAGYFGRDGEAAK